MKRITMEKVVYVSTDKVTPFTIKYNQLEAELNNDNIVEFSFPKGDYTRRVKQIQTLGYSILEWLIVPNVDSPIYSTYKGVFTK